MRFFVTGATGFIASHLINTLLSQGHLVYASRRSDTSHSRISLCSDPTWFTSPLDRITLETFPDVDVLIHLAAHTGNVPYDNLKNCLYWNLTSVIRLFDIALNRNVKRFVVAGSCFEYGKSGLNYSKIPASAPLYPTNSYAASKAAASISLCQWADENSVSLEILRIFHVFGLGELSSRFWPSLKHAALSGADFPMSNGEQIRDFQSVDQVAKVFANRSLLSEFKSGSNIFNIGSNYPSSLLDFAEYFWNLYNAKGRLLPGSIPYRNNEIMQYIPQPDLIISDYRHYHS